MKYLLRRLSTLSVLLFLACASVLVGQTITTGDITGIVKDSSGGIIPGATVFLKNKDNGQSRTQTVGDNGSYRFTALPPGSYQISATTPGLRSDVGSVNVSVGQAGTVNLTLKPEEAKETVMVTDSVPLLQSDNANLSETYSSRQIAALPMPGGDITTPAFTAPGVVVSTGAGYGNFSSHGLPGTSNLLTVNGSDNQDPYFNISNSGASNLALGSNEIAEVAVVQNAYSASYGRQAGAQVNEVTKSGTNEFHGNLNWNWNGSLLNANDFFNNATGTPKGRATSNQYAASIGGPVIKDKTFFFVDTEGLRYVLPSAGTVSLPTQQFEQYVLGRVSPAQQSLYQNAFNLYNSAPGADRAAPVTTGDGNLQDSSGALGCGSAAGNAAPGGGVFGTDVPCARAFGTNVTNQNTEWLLTARVDHQISTNQRIFFRFKTDHGVQPTATDPINPVFNATSTQPTYEGQADYTWTVSPSVVNHVIGSFGWGSAIFAPSSVPASLAAFPTFFSFSGTGGANGSDNALTQVGLQTTSFPQGRRVGFGQVIDDLSIIKGNHTIRLGGNYRKNRVTDLSNGTLSQGGAYAFADNTDFTDGVLASGSSSYRQRYSNISAAHIRLYNLGTYLQDDWAIRPNFKLTLGIRFDRNGNPSCLDNCFSRLSTPFVGDPNAAAVPYNQSIATGLVHQFANSESLVYQPRIAFVYSPGASSKTVLRGGFGIFGDQPPALTVPSTFQNFPGVYTPSVLQGNVGLGSLAGSAANIANTAGAIFQSGFTNGYTLGQFQSALPGVFTPPNIYSTPDKIYSPKYMEWNVDFQQQLTGKTSLSLSYVGNHGYNLLLENSLLNGFNQKNNPGFDSLPGAAPDARFRQVTGLANNGVSNYQGFTTQVRRSLGYGFQGQASYTWSHALDDLSSIGSALFNGTTSVTRLQYPYSKSLNYGNSDFDIRHNFVADFTWTLPYKSQHRILNSVIGGWTMGSKFYARSGTPFSALYANQGQYISNNLTGSLLGQLINPISTTCTSVNQRCFSDSDFSRDGFGNLSRNSFRGPGYFDIDYSITKAFQVRERARFQIGASFYNLLNHANFDAPNPVINSGGGTIQSTVSPPTSAYGSFQGSAVTGRVIVTNATFTF